MALDRIGERRTAAMPVPQQGRQPMDPSWRAAFHWPLAVNLFEVFGWAGARSVAETGPLERPQA